MGKVEKRSYNLEKLVEFIGDDDQAIRNMINIFLNNTPELIDRIVKGRNENDFSDMAKVAHMLKPTLDIFGVDKLHDVIRQLELLAKSNDGGPKTDELMKTIENTLALVYSELRNDYKLN